MRLKRSNSGVRVCALLSFVVLVALAFTAASALALTNPERHYEMVSPPFKGGFAVNRLEGVATSGESVAFYAPGAFAGAPSGFNGTGVDYLARRGVSEWSTTPIMAPAVSIAEPQAGDMTPSLEQVLEIGRPGAHSFHPLLEEDLLRHSTDTPDTSAEWELGGAVEPFHAPPAQQEFRLRYVAASLDLCHVLLSTSGTEPLLPEAVGSDQELYQANLGCDSEPKSLTLVGLNNKNQLINPACNTNIGGEEYLPPGHVKSAFNAVSADGGEVFFTVCVKASGQTFGSEVPHQLFVRLDGSRTLEVSRPLTPACVAKNVVGEVPCDGALERASADFAGASEDGSKVYFTTSAPLTEGDKDSGNDLYMATIGCPGSMPACSVAEREVTSLTQVSRDSISGQAANVLGVVRVAPDGRRVYFVAGGDLLTQAQREALEGEGRSVPQDGAANLYAYDSASGTMTFVGDLCSGTELSNAAQDIHCPSAGSDAHLWEDNEGQAQTGGSDGRFLVFATYAQLSGSDTNVAQDVYRYDSQTGRLTRLSGGEDGFDDNGNRTVLDGETGEPLGAQIAPGHYGGGSREQHEMNNRAVSEDGSRVVFTSAEPLSPNASNGLENVYEWREGPGEGTVSLVSTGSATEPVNDVVISASGRDVFFVTSQGLLPQDTDGGDDVYDARLGEGFAQVPAVAQPCSGDACQGPLTNPAPLLVPGSVSQALGENLPLAGVAGGIRPKAALVKCRKGYVKKKGRCVKRKARKVKRSSGRGGK